MINTQNLESLYGICGQLGGYRLLPVFQNTTHETRLLIRDFWGRNRALPAGADADVRAKQVVIMVIGPDGQPVAVSTVYRGDFTHTGMKNAPAGDFYFFRTFVQPSARVPNLSKKITLCTYEHLKSCAGPGKPAGLVIVAENPKLTKAVLERQLAAHGWAHIGEDAQGKVIMHCDF